MSGAGTPERLRDHGAGTGQAGCRSAVRLCRAALAGPVGQSLCGWGAGELVAGVTADSYSCAEEAHQGVAVGLGGRRRRRLRSRRRWSGRSLTPGRSLVRGKRLFPDRRCCHPASSHDGQRSWGPSQDQSRTVAGGCSPRWNPSRARCRGSVPGRLAAVFLAHGQHSGEHRQAVAGGCSPSRLLCRGFPLSRLAGVVLSHGQRCCPGWGRAA